MRISIEDYKKVNHSLFTSELIQVNEKTIKNVYKNKGYTDKSTHYGVIFQTHFGMLNLCNLLALLLFSNGILLVLKLQFV